MTGANGFLLAVGGVLLACGGGYVGYKIAKANHANEEQKAGQRVAHLEARVSVESSRLGHLETESRFFQFSNQAQNERIGHIEGYLNPPLDPTQ